MSVDLNPDVIAPEVQALLDAFDRLTGEAKRDALARLLRRSPQPEARSGTEEEEVAAVDAEDLDWGEITEEHQTQLVAEAFAAMDREEEAFARGDRRRPR